MRGMIAEIKPRLPTNTCTIFTMVVVSLLPIKYQFLWLQLRHFISKSKFRYWWISVFTRHLVM